MKHIIYLISWLGPVYVISFVCNLATTGFLSWFYGMRFDELTPRLYLWGWLACMALICLFINLFESGAAKLHYAGRNNYPLSITIVNQSVASVLYIVIAFLSNFKGLFYFPSVYLAYVINEFDPNIITNSNETAWTVILMLLHTLAFTAVGIIAYLKERKHLVCKYNDAMKAKESVAIEAK